MPSSSEFLAHLRANVPKVEAGLKPNSAPWEGGAASKQREQASEPVQVRQEVYVQNAEIASNVAAEPAVAAAPEAEAAPAPAGGALVRDSGGRFVPKVANQEPPATAEAEAEGEAVADGAIEVDGEQYDAARVKELANFRTQALRGETLALRASREASDKLKAAEDKLAGVASREAELAEREQHVDTLWNAAREKPDLFIQLAQADDGPARVPAGTPRAAQTQKDSFLTPEALNRELDAREKRRADSEAAAAKTANFEKRVLQDGVVKLAAGNGVLQEMMHARVAAHNAAGNITEDHSEQFIADALNQIHAECVKKLGQHNGVIAHKPKSPVAPPKVPPSPASGGTPLSPKEAPARNAKELVARISAFANRVNTARPAPARI